MPQKKRQKSGRAPSLWGKIRSYFLSGLLLSAPVFLTLYIIWSVITWADDAVGSIIPPSYSIEHLLPFHIPGLGILIVFAFLTLIGALTSGIWGTFFFKMGEKVFHKTPVVRSIYSAIKQIFETLFSKNTSAFREVGLIEYPRTGIWSLCFITGTTLGEVQQDTSDEVVNVFVPTTPNPTSGFLLFVPRKQIKTLTMTVEEGLKMVISAGMVTPLYKEAIPDSLNERPIKS